MGLKSFLLKLVVRGAVSFEEESYELYDGAAARADDEDTRSLLQELAGMEAAHVKKLKQLLEGAPDSKAPAEEPEQPPAGSVDEDVDAIRGFLGSEPLPPRVDPGELHRKSTHEILEFALARERLSVKFYLSLAESTPLPAVREVFTYLAAEEKSHVERIEAEMGRRLDKRES